jgi:hypothetical protein
VRRALSGRKRRFPARAVPYGADPRLSHPRDAAFAACVAGLCPALPAVLVVVAVKPFMHRPVYFLADSL